MRWNFYPLLAVLVTFALDTAIVMTFVTCSGCGGKKPMPARVETAPPVIVTIPVQSVIRLEQLPDGTVVASLD